MDDVVGETDEWRNLNEKSITIGGESSSDHDPLAQPIPNQLFDAQYFSMLGRGVAHYFLVSRNLAIR